MGKYSSLYTKKLGKQWQRNTLRNAKGVQVCLQSFKTKVNSHDIYYHYICSSVLCLGKVIPMFLSSTVCEQIWSLPYLGFYLIYVVFFCCQTLLLFHSFQKLLILIKILYVKKTAASPSINHLPLVTPMPGWDQEPGNITDMAGHWVGQLQKGGIVHTQQGGSRSG